MRKAFFIFLFFSFLGMLALADNATFSSPAEGEVWVRGTTHTITYTFSQEISWYALTLIHNGTQVGTFSYHNYTYPPGVYNYSWKVGYIDESANLAPPGNGYQIGFICGDAPCPIGISKKFSIGYNFSNIFKIKIFYYKPIPTPGGCPECLIILDLNDLRDELVKLDVALGVRLFWQGRIAADLGQVNSGRVFDAKPQVRLMRAPLAALKRGDEFELRLFDGAGRLLHAHAIRLVAAGR